MKTVILNGTAWKFSKKSWKCFLEKWTAIGMMPVIAQFATCICENSPNITDWNVETASYALKLIDHKCKPKSA